MPYSTDGTLLPYFSSSSSLGQTYLCYSLPFTMQNVKSVNLLQQVYSHFAYISALLAISITKSVTNSYRKLFCNVISVFMHSIQVSVSVVHKLFVRCFRSLSKQFPSSGAMLRSHSHTDSIGGRRNFGGRTLKLVSYIWTAIGQYVPVDRDV